jgi:hypothetical protein
MYKRLLSSAALALAFAVPVHAQTLWEFSYTGFSDGQTFHPDYEMHGSFLGEDANHDGVLQQSELQNFVWNGIDYALDGSDYCYAFRCTLNGFSYSLDGRLDFSTNWRYSDDHMASSGYTIAGVSDYRVGWAGNGPVSSSTLYWTEQTHFEITPPPVPEPGSAAMLGVGLLAAAGLRRLRLRRRDAA